MKTSDNNSTAPAPQSLCSSCATCPAAMWCLTGMGHVKLCFFCDSRVSIGPRTPHYLHTTGRRAGPEGIYTGRRIAVEHWEKWKKKYVKGINIEDVPSRENCHLLNSPAQRTLACVAICDTCFRKIEEVISKKGVLSVLVTEMGSTAVFGGGCDTYISVKVHTNRSGETAV